MAEKDKPKTGLMAALIQAQSKVESVKKGSTNTFHKYSYASAEDVLTGAREALDDCGLAVFQAGWEFVEIGREVIRPDGGKETLDAPILGVCIGYEVHHAESGESASYKTVVPVREEKGRPLDKALFGALTEGLAYFLRGLLLIPRADAQTPSERDDTKFTPAAPAPKATPSAKAAAPKPDPWRVFAEGVKELFPGMAPAVVKEKITAAGKTVCGDAFDGDWQKLQPPELLKLLKALKEAKEAEAAS